jgi:putative flippase GtrA
MSAVNRSRSALLSQAWRFLIVGGLNTLLTYAVFIGLGLVMPPWIAYSIAFALGLLWTGFGSSRFVFRGDKSFRRMLLFLGWYLLLFGLGQLVVHLVNPSGFPQLVVVSAIVILVTAPLTFIGGRFVFGGPDVVANPAPEVRPR